MRRFLAAYNTPELRMRTTQIIESSAILGHAAASISLQYYFHAASLVVSTNYRPNIHNGLGPKAISFLLGEEHETIKKFIQRSGYSSVRTRYLKPHKYHTKIAPSKELPSELAAEPATISSKLNIIAQWIYGKNIESIASESLLSELELISALTTFRASVAYPSAVSMRIDTHQINAALGWLKDQSHTCPEPNSRRRINLKLLNRWIRDLEAVPNEDQTAHLDKLQTSIGRIQWPRKGAPHGLFSAQEQAEVNSALSKLLAPIQLNRDPDFENARGDYELAKFEIFGDSSYSSRNTVTLILHMILHVLPELQKNAF